MPNLKIILLILLLFPLKSFSSINFLGIPLGKLDMYTISGTDLEDYFKLKNSLTISDSIEKVSSLFIGFPYKANSLIGSLEQDEKLVIDFSGIDCFTYLDYVEALRLSIDMNDFVFRLKEGRYFKGNVSFLSRKHFFSDWVSAKNTNVFDVSTTLDPKFTVSVEKNLNQKKDGGRYIEKLEIKKRLITYIPILNDENIIDHAVFSNLQNGDYIGIYTDIVGLDVTHTGLLIEKENRFFLRHASSKKSNRKVVDEDFLTYMKGKKGFLVYRAI